MKKIVALVLVLSLVFALSACFGKGENAVEDITPKVEVNEPSDNDTMSDNEEKTVLYIGTADDGFKEYEAQLSGELTAEGLIDEIEALTGWDLELSEAVTSGKGGMTVCFANTSSLFAGPPEVQKEEFHMFDAYQLTQTILDSVKKTLQMNFVSELGNPDTLDIYYCMEGGEALEITSIDRVWSLEEPYKW